jgi:hypothetical protein
MARSIAGGFAEGLEKILAEQFLKAQEAQRIKQFEAQLGLQRDRMAQDASQFDRTFGETQSQNEFGRNLQAANMAMRGTEFSQGVMENEAERTARENEAAARIAMQGTQMANENNQAALDRSSSERMAGMRAQTATEPLVSVQGPDGQAVLVPRSQAAGMTPTTARKPVLGTERSALSFFNRAKEAEVVAAGLEPEVSKMGLAGQTAMQLLPNFMQSQTGQSYRQAQRAFTEARLRKESGAAIPQSEFDNDARMYFAQPGDSPETIEQKRQARQEVLDGLAFSSGQAYQEYYGEPFQRGAARPAGANRREGLPDAGGALNAQDLIRKYGGAR